MILQQNVLFLVLMEENAEDQTYADVQLVSKEIIVKLEDDYQRHQVAQNLVEMAHVN